LAGRACSVAPALPAAARRSREAERYALASETRPETKSRVGLSADLDERVVTAQRAAEHGEPGLLADRLDHENAVGVREIDPGSRAPALEGSPDRLGHLALERWRVELAFETPALEADEEGAAGEAVEERLGGVDERRDGRARFDPYGPLDRQQLGEHARQEGIARERVPHPVEHGRHVVHPADDDVAIPGPAEPAEPPQQ